MKYLSICLTLSLNSSLSFASLTMHKTPSPLKLEKELGGRADGSAWTSQELKDKISVVFYVAPDQKELNDKASKALKKEKFDRNFYRSIAVVNMAASWIPDFLIEKKIKKSQEEFKDTLYLKDKKSVFVKKWGLKDKSSDILVFNEKGELIFRFDGKLADSDIKALVSTVKKAVTSLKQTNKSKTVSRSS